MAALGLRHRIALRVESCSYFLEMNTESKRISPILALSIAGAIALLGIAFLWFLRAELGELWQQLRILSRYLEGVPPILYVFGFGVVTAIPIPSSPLILAAGAFYGFWMGLLVIAVGLLITLSLSYWLALFALRDPIEKLLRWRGYTLPEFPTSDTAYFVLLVRFTPGVPLVFLNYLLGIARVPFKTYLIVSWPVVMLISIPFILAGSSVYEGKLGLVIPGIFLILFLILLSKYVFRMVKRKSDPDLRSQKSGI